MNNIFICPLCGMPVSYSSHNDKDWVCITCMNPNCLRPSTGWNRKEVCESKWNKFKNIKNDDKEITDMLMSLLFSNKIEFNIEDNVLKFNMFKSGIFIHITNTYNNLYTLEIIKEDKVVGKKVLKKIDIENSMNVLLMFEYALRNK